MCSGAASPTRARTTTPRPRSPSRRRWSTRRFHLFRHALSSHHALNGELEDFPRTAGTRFPAASSILEQLADLEATCQPQLPKARASATTPRRRQRTDRGIQAPADRSSRAVRAGGQAQVGFFPRHRRQPLPRHRRDRRQGIGHPLRLAAQRVRPLDHRSRESRLCRRHPTTNLLARAGTHLPRSCPKPPAAQTRSRRRSRASSTCRWRRPTSSAPATAARGCRFPRSTSAPKSCATGWART